MKLRKWCAWCGLGASVCKCKNPSLLTDYSEVLDWFLSLLSAAPPTDSICACNKSSGVMPERARLRAIIDAERGK